jgi:hypothetical protein
MEWNVHYEEWTGVVEVTVVGPIRVEQVAEMARQIIATARDKRCYKCLIDYRHAEADFSTLDAYTFMTGLKELGATFTDRVAIVYSTDAAKHRFAETVSLNRGWANIRYFSDIESATDWLSAATT